MEDKGNPPPYATEQGPSGHPPPASNYQPQHHGPYPPSEHGGNYPTSQGYYPVPQGYYPPPQPMQQSQASTNVVVVQGAAPATNTVIVQKRGVNHCMHCCISVFFFPWIIVWICLCISHGC
uniref:Uncharacterized protein n=1 Tax=Arion vulgaris TaxID=1028688 RepID=A0A0B6ZSM0_9EUPU